MEMEKSKVLIQFLVISGQFGDVLFFLYARRFRGYTATLRKAVEQKERSLFCNVPESRLLPNLQST